MAIIVSDAAWNSRPYSAVLFCSAMAAISAGRVKTTWSETQPMIRRIIWTVEPDGQQVGLALGQPAARGGALAAGAVPVATGVVGDPPMAAVGASLYMPAERCGAAMLDRRHDLELLQAQMPGTGGR